MDITAPWAVTQEGIAFNIDVERKNLSMVLKQLWNEGLIIERKEHVKGSKTIRKIYALTENGHEEAVNTSELLGAQQLTLIDLEGNSKKVLAKDVPTFLTIGADLLDILLATRDGFFNCREFRQREARSQRRLVDMIESMPVTRRFFGRLAELEELRKFSGSKTIRVVTISGIAGIGKTTLASAFVSEIRKNRDLFWFRVHEWTGLRGFLSGIGDFMDGQNKPALSRYLESSDEIDLDKVALILKSELSSTNGIAIIDDVHKAEKSIVDALRVIFQLVMERDSWFKLLVIGRSIPKFFDVRDSVIRGSVKEIILGALDQESSSQILLSRGIPTQYHPEALAMAKGHPLFLELFEHTSRAHSIEFADFLEGEVHESLSPIEKRVMVAAALARYALLPEAFLVCCQDEERRKESAEDKLDIDVQGALISLRERNLLFDAPYGTIDSHDLLKEFFANRSGSGLRRQIHLCLAKFYSDDDSPFSATEAIHHLAHAGELDLAFQIANSYADDIISKVGYQTLRELFDLMLKRSSEEQMRPTVLITRAKVEEAEGDWNGALISLGLASDMLGRHSGRDTLELMRLEGSILLRKGDSAKAKQVLLKAWDEAKAIGDRRLLALVSGDLGSLLHRMGELDRARTFFEESLESAGKIGDEVLRGRGLYGIAKILSAQEKIAEAISTDEKALEVLRKTGAISDQAKVLVSMGIYHDATNEFDKAIACQEEAYSLASKAGDVVTQAYALANSASTYMRTGDFRKAEKSINESREVFQKIGDEMMLSLVELIEGTRYAKEGDWGKAELCFERCIEIANRSMHAYHLANWLISIAETYESSGKKEKALTYLEQAMEICKKQSLDDLSSFISLRIQELRKEKV